MKKPLKDFEQRDRLWPLPHEITHVWQAVLAHEDLRVLAPAALHKLSSILLFPSLHAFLVVHVAAMGAPSPEGRRTAAWPGPRPTPGEHRAGSRRVCSGPGLPAQPRLSMGSLTSFHCQASTSAFITALLPEMSRPPPQPVTTFPETASLQTSLTEHACLLGVCSPVPPPLEGTRARSLVLCCLPCEDTARKQSSVGRGGSSTETLTLDVPGSRTVRQEMRFREAPRPGCFTVAAEQLGQISKLTDAGVEHLRSCRPRPDLSSFMRPLGPGSPETSVRDLVSTGSKQSNWVSRNGN